MKQQHGFVTPSEFNSFIRNAQNEVFKELISLFRFALSDRNRFIQYSRGNYGGFENIKDDLRPCLVESEDLIFDEGTFVLPEDYAYYLSAYYENFEIDIVDKHELSKLQNAYHGKPTFEFPVGSIDRDGIKVLPSVIVQGVRVYYYKYPQGIDADGNPVAQSPTYATTTVGDVSVFDPANSIDFELGQATEYKLAQKVLGYIGINLREQDLMQWSAYKKQEDNEQEK